MRRSRCSSPPTAPPAPAAGPAETSWSADSTRTEQDRRDRLDAAQSMKAADAVVIDSTRLGLDQVIDLIVGLARERAGLPSPRRAGS